MVVWTLSLTLWAHTQPRLWMEDRESKEEDTGRPHSKA